MFSLANDAICLAITSVPQEPSAFPGICMDTFNRETIMLRGGLLWLIGIPIPAIIILWLLGYL